MKPCDSRTSGTGDNNAVVLAVGLWAARDGIHLRIDTTGADPHATVKHGAGSVRGHRILLGDLRKALMAEGCWASGEEGAEVQAPGSAGD